MLHVGMESVDVPSSATCGIWSMITNSQVLEYLGFKDRIQVHSLVIQMYTAVRLRGRPSKRTLGPKRTTLQGESPSKRTLKFSPEIFYISLKWSPKHPTSVFQDHYRFFCCDSNGPGYDVC